MSDPTMKRQVRRRNHIAKDLRTPKYREKSVPAVKAEDEDERRFRRYKGFDEHFLMEGYHPLNYDKDEE